MLALAQYSRESISICIVFEDSLEVRVCVGGQGGGRESKHRETDAVTKKDKRQCGVRTKGNLFHAARKIISSSRAEWASHGKVEGDERK